MSIVLGLPIVPFHGGGTVALFQSGFGNLCGPFTNVGSNRRVLMVSKLKQWLVLAVIDTNDEGSKWKIEKGKKEKPG